MKKHRKSLTAFLLSLFLLSGCSCNHNWRNATCITPKTCSKCGITEGNALGHRCGEPQVKNDIISASVITKQYCEICHVCLRQESHQMDSLVKDNLFLFTPKEFLERLTHIGQETYPDFHYEIQEDQDSLNALIFWGNETGEQSMVCFFKPDRTTMGAEDLRSKNVWCVSLSGFGSIDNFGCLLTGDMTSVFYQACDPMLDDNTYSTLQAMKLAAFLNAVEYDEPAGYIEKNGLFYEFMHSAVDAGDLSIGLESILVYATNWLDE